MAYQRGSDMLLSIDVSLTATPSYTPVAGLTTKSLNLKSGTVEVTNQDSPNKWRELLANAAIREGSISAAAVFTDSASENKLMNVFMAGGIIKYQVFLPSFGTLSGLFQVTQLKYDGKHDDNVAWDLSLESAGELTWTPA